MKVVCHRVKIGPLRQERGLFHPFLKSMKVTYCEPGTISGSTESGEMRARDCANSRAEIGRFNQEEPHGSGATRRQGASRGRA